MVNGRWKSWAKNSLGLAHPSMATVIKTKHVRGGINFKPCFVKPVIEVPFQIKRGLSRLTREIVWLMFTSRLTH